MNFAVNPPSAGHVASLHLHPSVGGQPLSEVACIQVEADKGIVGNRRYYDRRSAGGVPSARQISLIEREQISEHAAVLGLPRIPPGAVRSNVETTGIELVALIGRKLRIGETVLEVTKPRDPCAKMDQICQGLRSLMEPNRQGVLARVLHSGSIKVGDRIELMPEAAEQSS